LTTRTNIVIDTGFVANTCRTHAVAHAIHGGLATIITFLAHGVGTTFLIAGTLVIIQAALNTSTGHNITDLRLGTVDIFNAGLGGFAGTRITVTCPAIVGAIADALTS